MPVPRQVSAHVWYVQGLAALGSRANRNFISNAGFVLTPAGVVVVDGLGSPALARELIAQIRRLSDRPITHVLVTHYHADHVYGLQVYKQAGARIVAHRAAREYLASETASLRLKVSLEQGLVEPGTRLVPADDWLGDDHTLNLGGMSLRMLHVGPSHTPEDLALHLPADGIVFAGDLVFNGRIPFVGQANSRGWIASLDKLLALGAETIVPGHGPLSMQGEADLKFTRDYLGYLRRTMGRAARDMQPFEEAYAAADWSAYEHMPMYEHAHRMNAYNTYLLMEHESD